MNKYQKFLSRSSLIFSQKIPGFFFQEIAQAISEGIRYRFLENPSGINEGIQKGFLKKIQGGIAKETFGRFFLDFLRNLSTNH